MRRLLKKDQQDDDDGFFDDRHSFLIEWLSEASDYVSTIGTPTEQTESDVEDQLQVIPLPTLAER